MIPKVFVCTIKDYYKLQIFDILLLFVSETHKDQLKINKLSSLLLVFICIRPYQIGQCITLFILT